MGRPSSTSKSRRSESSSGSSSQAGTSSKSLFAEARRLAQQASRKPEGPSRSAALRTCVELFRNGLSLPQSAKEREEALFDLGEVLLQLCSSTQAEASHVRGFFDGTVKKAQAAELQVQNAVRAAGICRESAEAFESVCTMKGQLEQEGLVNNGVALCDCAELALEIPEANGGGVGVSKELLSRAHERYSAALQVAPVDVELLMNYADCRVRMAELEFDYPTASSTSGRWEVVRGMYDQALSAYASGCANADARIGDDLAGLLHNWASGIISLAERSSDLDEIFKLALTAQEKFASAIKFRPTDTSIKVGMGECFAGLVDKLAGMVGSTQQLLDLLRISCDEGYAAALKVDSKNPAALLGLGDAHLSAGKLVAERGQLQAQGHYGQSVQAFQQAFDLLKAGKWFRGFVLAYVYRLVLGGFPNLRNVAEYVFAIADMEKTSSFKYEELCDFLYNYACAAALSGNVPKASECIEHLLSLGAVILEEAEKDPDLGSLRSLFQSRMGLATPSS
ncbi:hypothetical protein R1sor_019236 [Riccia sorocarpa]|uniref:Uncharacterized protein n=1 Tax=Riccia sorocarpa TaxID=122646 RepID=A0ABD3IDP4_9MARC